MQNPPEGIHRHRTSNRQFLFSKTRTAIETEAAGGQEGIPLNRMRQAFPNFLEENAFIQEAMQRLEPVESFCALLIRIDETPDGTYAEEVMIALANAVDGLCRETSGIWGLWRGFLLGCFLPNKNQKAGLNAAGTIRKRLAASRAETISEGVAVYPTLSYEKQQILENAQKALDHAEFFGPGACVAFDAVSLNISGDKAYQNGDIEGAIQEFRLALAMDGRNVNVHNSLGVCYGIQDQLDRALDEFQTAIALDPKESLAVYNAGYVYFLKKAYAKALDFFLAAAKMDPDVFEIALQTGRVYLELDHPETARNHLERATRLNPKSAPAFRIIGDCDTKLSRPSDAVTAYKTALKLNPEDALALSALGYLYEMQGKNADIALMFCRQSVDIAPEDGLLRHRLGSLYLNRGLYEEALKELQRAEELGQDTKNEIRKTLKLMKAGEAPLSERQSPGKKPGLLSKNIG
jgi:tetratricopeptide (TPR) repeat protein